MIDQSRVKLRRRLKRSVEQALQASAKNRQRRAQFMGNGGVGVLECVSAWELTHHPRRRLAPAAKKVILISVLTFVNRGQPSALKVKTSKQSMF